MVCVRIMLLMLNRKLSGGCLRWNRCCSVMLIEFCELYRKISVNVMRNDGNVMYSFRKCVMSDVFGNGLKNSSVVSSMLNIDVVLVFVNSMLSVVSSMLCVLGLLKKVWYVVKFSL